jgi:hypothetical protein
MAGHSPPVLVIGEERFPSGALRPTVRSVGELHERRRDGERA